MPVKRHMHETLGFAAIVALAGMGFGAQAAQLEVTATLPDSCTVEGGTLAFGTVDPSDTTPLANAPINVECTANASVNIALDGGLYYTLGANGRAMKRSGSNDYLNYKLYTNASYSSEWAKDLATSHNVFVGSNAITIYGKIDVQTKPGGDYADTVQITMVVN
jgi:spore coat protein U domain-containing protein, fimbrial subunit CupE1/2/3/6